MQELIKWRYRRMDALVTLTKADLRDYRETLPKKPSAWSASPTPCRR